VRTLVSCIGIAAALAVASCSARRGEPLRGSFAPESDAVLRGRLVFFQECHKCHPGGEAGLGPALNDKPLPRFLMGFQVRRGLGVMPSFSEGEISGAELDALTLYLRELRRH
jgi:mono/diheme cytochrome c family protein